MGDLEETLKKVNPKLKVLKLTENGKIWAATCLLSSSSSYSKTVAKHFVLNIHFFDVNFSLEFAIGNIIRFYTKSKVFVAVHQIPCILAPPTGQ